METISEWICDLFFPTRFSACSIIGHKETNEDRYLFLQNNNVTLGMVADGVGGHNHGEFASDLCVKIFEQRFNLFHSSDSPNTFLRETIIEVAKCVLDKGITNAEFKGCGTTVSGFFIVENSLYIMNVGDSRVYKITAEDNIIRLTKDHTFVQRLVDEGHLSKELSLHHPDRHLMFSAIGQSVDEITIDMRGPEKINKNEILVACTDGVHDTISDDKIRSIIVSNRINNCARALIDVSYEMGSHDNITACVYKKK